MFSESRSGRGRKSRGSEAFKDLQPYPLRRNTHHHFVAISTQRACCHQRCWMAMRKQANCLLKFAKNVEDERYEISSRTSTKVTGFVCLIESIG